MEIIVLSEQPQILVYAINNAIQKNELKTWDKVADKKNETVYTHTPRQWDEKIMIKPHINSKYVLFEIILQSSNTESLEFKQGYILGRFIEILIVHFKKYFTSIRINP